MAVMPAAHRQGTRVWQTVGNDTKRTIHERRVIEMKNDSYSICSKSELSKDVCAGAADVKKSNRGFKGDYKYLGVKSKEDEELLSLLSKTKGVGIIRSANLFAKFGGDELRRIIASGDVKALSEAKEISEKLAYRILETFNTPKNPIEELSEAEWQALFGMLMEVKGMTDKTAERLLTIEPNELRRYVVTDNAAALSKKSAISKRLAEGVVVKLKDYFLEKPFYDDDGELIGDSPEEVPDAPLVVEEDVTDVADTSDVPDSVNAFLQPTQLSCSIAVFTGWECINIK